MLCKDLVSVMDKVLLPALVSHDGTKLLQRSIRARVRCHIDMGQPTGPVLDDHKHVEHPERRSDRHEKVTGKDRSSRGANYCGPQ